MRRFRFLGVLIVGMFGLTITGCCSSGHGDCGGATAPASLSMDRLGAYSGDIDFARAAIHDALGGSFRIPTDKGHALAMSSGGQFGAYSAGFLAGWSTEPAPSGPARPPTFDVVTGVSAGATVAPFAYLGDRVSEGEGITYLELGERIYRDISSSDVFRERIVTGALFGSSLTSTAPYRKLAERILTEEMASDIADEYSRTGRCLLIGATDLNEGRMRIFDLGAIAASDLPDRVDLMRRVILASSAVPAIFEPVEIEGRLFVDGAAIQGVFLPSLYKAFSSECSAMGMDPSVYVVLNDYAEPSADCVDNCLLPVTGRSLDLALRQSMCLAIEGIERSTLSAGGSFWFTSAVRGECPAPQGFGLARAFDTEFMNCLADQGRKRASDGSGWSAAAPDCFVGTSQAN